MKNLLNSVKVQAPTKSFFDMSYEHKTTFNIGDLIPISCEPVVPTDRWSGGTDSLIKFQPLLAPLMHNVDVKTETWFVPYRLLWRGTTQNNRWNDYIANIKTLGVLPVVPFLNFNSGNTGVQTLADYLNVPTFTAGGAALACFNWAAYQCIWNERYRDENLDTEINYLLSDGDNTGNAAALMPLRRRRWEKDYFTGSLPFAQKGDAVSIPLGSVELNPAPVLVPGAFKQAGSPTNPAIGAVTGGAGVGDLEVGGVDAVYDPNGTLIVGPTDINQLRLAQTLQRWYEQLARGGTRPTEFLKVIFGIQSQDARLQQPEYITGTTSPIQFSEVLNTTGSFDPANPTDPSSPPMGSMAGHGRGITSGNKSSYFVQEYGVIMTMMSVMPKPAYFQGIPKQYLKRNDPTEHFIPTFDHLGEQEILQEEIWAETLTPNDTFGYVPRYCEYKVPINRISGEFKTNLLFWTLAREFATEPFLNDVFIECDGTSSDMTRIFAVQGNNSHILVAVWNEQKMVRPMSKYSTPTW